MSKKALLHVYHGGGFQRMPPLVYYEENISEFECECKMLNVNNIRANILALGYSGRMIKSLYLASPIWPLRRA